MDTGSTRDRLLVATRDAIRALGLPAVTAREITGRASANLAAIPYHFGSKDALVSEALVSEAQELLTPVLKLLESERPAAERASAAVSMLTGLFDETRDQAPVYLAALAAAPHSPGVQAGIGELWEGLRGRLAGDVARQLEDGLLPAWVEPSAMAALILAVVNGVVVSSVVDPRGPDHRAVAGQFLALLLAAAEPVTGHASKRGAPR